MLGISSIALAAAVGHAPSLTQPHFENDEAIFTFLAERLRADPLSYNVRGTLEGGAARRFLDDVWTPSACAGVTPETQRTIRAFFASKRTVELLIDPSLPERTYLFDPAIYDRPLFFHPPLYPYTLALFRTLFGSVGGPLLSALTHVATIVMVGLLGLRFGGGACGLWAAAFAAFNPVSWLAGSRVWIDSMLEMMVTASVLAAFHAADRRTARSWALAGAVFGLACLTKLPALFAAPALAVVAFHAKPRLRSAEFAAAALPIVVLIASWLVITRVSYGAWIPLARPTPWLVERFAYVRFILNRPWHFYASGLFLVFPACAYGIRVIARQHRTHATLATAAWALSVIAALSILGVLGQGFQLRYIVHAVPAVCLIAGLGASRVSRWAQAVAVLLLGVSFSDAFRCGIDPSQAELVPLALGSGLRLVGLRLGDVLPRFW